MTPHQVAFEDQVSTTDLAQTLKGPACLLDVVPLNASLLDFVLAFVMDKELPFWGDFCLIQRV